MLIIVYRMEMYLSQGNQAHNRQLEDVIIRPKSSFNKFPRDEPIYTLSYKFLIN